MMGMGLLGRRGAMPASAFLFSMLIAATVNQATAQTGDALYNRLDRLERDIRTLNIQRSRGAAAAGSVSAATAGAPSADPGFARLSVRMDEMEQDLRAATGGMEQLNYRMGQILERLEKLSSDVEYRLGILEGGARSGSPLAAQPTSAAEPSLAPARSIGSVQSPVAVAAKPIASAANTAAPGLASSPKNLGTVSAKAVDEVAKTGQEISTQLATAATQPAPAPVVKSGPAATGALPAGTVREQYTYAFNLLRQTNYDQAEIALNAFIKAHGDDPLAANARYWLGETHYVRADYQQAAQVFYEGFRADPQGAKAPDLLLKLGMSLANLGKKTEACTTFQKVLSDYPKAPTGIRDALRRESAKSGCS